MSFALATLFGLLLPFLITATPALALVKYLAFMNGALALFNLIPGFPLVMVVILSGLVSFLPARNASRLVEFYLNRMLE